LSSVFSAGTGQVLVKPEIGFIFLANETFIWGFL